MTGRRLLVPLVLLRDLIVAGLFVAVVWPLWILPWGGAATLGRWYGYVVDLLWVSGRRVGMINLRRAYGPDLTPRDARRRTRAVFGSLGQSLAEGAQFARRFGQAGWDWAREYEPEDPALEQRILADPRPKILVSGHLGSWEVAVAIAGQRVGPGGSVIARHVDNPVVDRIFRWIRTRSGRHWIDKRGGASEALARLRAGESVAMLLDENAGHRGVFVDYFGRPASTSRLPAQLSLMTGAPVVLGAAVREEGRARFLYRLAIFEPPDPAAGPDGVRDLTARIVQQWEEWVRLTPLQWRWVHWRWKTRPDGSLETYGRRDVVACFGDPDARRGKGSS